MKTMTIKEYAISNKLSIYNVVKMTQNGSLETELKKVNGKDEVFILVDETKSISETAQTPNEEAIDDYKKAYFKLKLKYDQLKIKFDKLQTK